MGGKRAQAYSQSRSYFVSGCTHGLGEVRECAFWIVFAVNRARVKLGSQDGEEDLL